MPTCYDVISLCVAKAVLQSRRTMTGISFDSFSSSVFEEFCFDLLQVSGFVNVDWRKGTGRRF